MKKRILVVDDSNTILISIEGILSRAGFEVATCISGEVALSKVLTFKPDLIITDLNMPGINGIELIKKLKKLKETRFKPILMLTTESQISSRHEAKAAGATGWLVKPANPKDLVQVIDKLLA